MDVDKQQQQHLRNALSLAMGLIFSVNRTVEVFSRVAGSTGDWYFGIFLLIGVSVQLYFCEVNAQVSGTPDLIPVHVMIMATIVWSVHSICRLIRRADGRQQHSYDMGVGILEAWLIAWPPRLVDVLSNAVVAAVIGGCCHLLKSPILGRWYFSVGIWLVATDGFLAVRDRLRGQRMVDARPKPSTCRSTCIVSDRNPAS